MGDCFLGVLAPRLIDDRWFKGDIGGLAYRSWRLN